MMAGELARAGECRGDGILQNDMGFLALGRGPEGGLKFEVLTNTGVDPILYYGSELV